MNRLLLVEMVLLFLFPTHVAAADTSAKFWPIQSVDTMKYSRDMARIEAKNSKFDQQIDHQMQDIANLGATYVAISTPYDAEFVPYLYRWVKYARIHDLHVWFRGNFSGWENWYGYPDITPSEHIEKVRQFILSNEDLFVDGDIFSPCHECENGGPGDPRQTGHVKEYRDFLISEYQVARDSFKKINKDVASNYFSMNLDVAKLIMDKDTTKSLDNIIVLDHYVFSPSQLAQDVKDMATKTGATIVLGEYGAPIPDIHGSMNPTAQANWLSSAMKALVKIPELGGLNYWVNIGGSTEIWNSVGQKRPAAGVISQYYFPNILEGDIQDPLGRPVSKAKVQYLGRNFAANAAGHYTVPLMPGHPELLYTADGFVSQNHSATTSSTLNIVLEPSRKNILYHLQELIHLLVGKTYSIIKSI